MQAAIITAGFCFLTLLGLLLFFFPPAMFICEGVTAVIVGYVLSSMTLYTMDDFEWKKAFWWYNCLFLIATLITMTVCIPLMLSWSCMILSAVWGSFAIIQGIALYKGTHSSYIMINSFKYNLNSNYHKSYNTPTLFTEGMYTTKGFFSFTLCTPNLVSRSYIQITFYFASGHC